MHLTLINPNNNTYIIITFFQLKPIYINKNILNLIRPKNNTTQN